MVKIKVNVKTKNDSIPSDTTKRKMPVITNPKGTYIQSDT